MCWLWESSSKCMKKQRKPPTLLCFSNTLIEIHRLENWLKSGSALRYHTRTRAWIDYLDPKIEYAARKEKPRTMKSLIESQKYWKKSTCFEKRRLTPVSICHYTFGSTTMTQQKRIRAILSLHFRFNKNKTKKEEGYWAQVSVGDYTK